MDNQTDSNKQRILSYAEGMLLKEGVASISIDELSSSLGMSKKTFYKVFPSKESMIEELVERIVGDLAGRITSIADGPGNFVEKIDALMRFLGSIYRRLAIPLSGEVYRRAPHVWQRVEEFRENMIRRVFTRLLEQGSMEGFIRSDVNRSVFMMAYLSAIRTIIRPHVILEQGLSISDAIEQIFRIFFAGILTSEGRHALDQLQTSKPHIP
jgi:TetR/AcrR family transcriptional regulator, cholesterol catabolism regulator